jgi:8-hydroxy-5-deazaflavin:NADPH oxidoreductase
MQIAHAQVYIGPCLTTKPDQWKGDEMQLTIAVIGAGGNMGSGIARSLAQAGHRVLIADRNTDKLQNLYSSIKRRNPAANIEILGCSREASWEADVIIPAVPHTSHAEIAARIRDVVTGKIVINIDNPPNATSDENGLDPRARSAEDLSTLLPHAKIVRTFDSVLPNDFSSPIADQKVVDCLVTGDDDQAVATVAGLVADAGFRPRRAG